ncbi:MAG: hypothetical protein HY000_22570, partial [Planctomycetes bacterium]|nr:hypothetical protein [Planctomycetota bacterium]
MKRATHRGLLARIVSSLASRRVAKQGHPRLRELGVEGLESRSLLTAVAWDGGGGDLDWNNAANWSGDLLPAADDDVTINAAGDVTILHSFGAAEIHSLVSHDSINWSGGSLAVNADSTGFGQFDNAGSVAVQAGTLALRGGGASNGSFM